MGAVLQTKESQHLETTTLTRTAIPFALSDSDLNWMGLK